MPDIHYNIRCFAQFGTVCTIFKKVKNTHGGMLLLVKLQASVCNFTKNNTPPRVFLMFFKIVQMVSNCAKHPI